MAKKAVPIFLMLAGAAMLIGIGLFALDKATSPEPAGLGTWISTVLGLLLGASAGIKGWVDWNKKETPPQAVKNIAMDHAQLAAGDMGRNIQTKDSSHYVEQNIEHYYEAARPDASFHPLHQLPQPPADFTGRDELIALLLADFEHGNGAHITGLTGMGGIGKTALGLVVAHRVAQHYPDAQIFLDLKGTTTPLSAMDVMRHVILSFEPTMDLRALDETGMANAYRSTLHGRRALLFLDNARSAEQIAPLRPPETCTMLVTSRWTFAVPGLQTRRVDLLSAENAKDFLLELCPRIGGHAAGLAAACGYLPLALRIAGSFLGVNNDWEVETYLARLNDRKQRLTALQQSREEAELKTEPDLLATFELSYGQLSEEDQKRWRRLGVFPASFDARAAGAMWGAAEETARKALGVWHRYSLLDYDEPSSRYSLHDLLVDYALSQIEPEEEHHARLQHADHYMKVLSTANYVYWQGGENMLTGLRLFDLEWENIHTGQAWAAAAPGNDRAAADLCMAYSDRGAHILNVRRHPRERIRWAETALTAARALGDRSLENSALSTLGIAHADLGETNKAIQFHEQYLSIAREASNRRGEGMALGNLGAAYYELGEAHKALQFYEQQLAIARETGDRRGEGFALGNLGIGYYDLGEVRKAIQFFEQDLAIARETGDRRGEGTTLGNLGVAYRNLGEAHKALQFHEQQLAIARELGDRRGEGMALSSLANTYADLKETYKAIQFYEQALVIARETGNRRGEATALNGLGTAYFRLGETHKASAFYGQVLVIAHETGNRMSEAHAFWGLAECKKQAGDPGGAREMLQRALAIFKEIESPKARLVQKNLIRLEGFWAVFRRGSAILNESEELNESTLQRLFDAYGIDESSRLASFFRRMFQISRGGKVP
jgi:tetratricopeptide (TPR) repeat protein